MEEKEFRDQQLEQKEEKNDKVIASVKVDEKNEKKSKRKILLLLLLLLMTGFLLTTSTYAWFTSNKTVTVSDINVNVASSGGIQVSVDGSNWKAIVTNEDITGAITTYGNATNQIPTSLQPVSTAANSLNNGYLSMWHGTVASNSSGDYILTAKDVSTVTDNSKTEGIADTGSNGHFVAFDLFFKLDAEDAVTTSNKIYLTTSSDVVAETDTGIKNASRVAFIVEGDAANGSSTETIQGLTASSINNNVFVWEPNYDVHKNAAVSNAKDVYGITTTTTGGEKLAYDGITAAISASDNIKLGDATAAKNSAKFASITPTHYTTESWGTGEGSTDFVELFTLSTDKITKVRVYFWVEGQDVDCENNASGGEITLKLQFSLNSSSAS